MISTDRPIGAEGASIRIFEAGPDGRMNLVSPFGNLERKINDPSYTSPEKLLANFENYHVELMAVPEGKTQQEFDQGVVDSALGFDKAGPVPYNLVPESTTAEDYDKNSNSFTGSVFRANGNDDAPDYWAPGYGENIKGMVAE